MELADAVWNSSISGSVVDATRFPAASMILDLSNTGGGGIATKGGCRYRFTSNRLLSIQPEVHPVAAAVSAAPVKILVVALSVRLPEPYADLFPSGEILRKLVSVDE